MKPGEQSNAEIKLQALQTVVDSNLTDSDKLLLINAVETYLPQVEVFDAREEVMQSLQTVELSWSERILQERRNKARDAGILKGMHELLLFQLTCKFVELPSNFVNQLNAITDHELLAAIAIQVLTVRALDEITLTSTLA